MWLQAGLLKVNPAEQRDKDNRIIAGYHNVNLFSGQRTSKLTFWPISPFGPRANPFYSRLCRTGAGCCIDVPHAKDGSSFRARHLSSSSHSTFLPTIIHPITSRQSLFYFIFFNAGNKGILALLRKDRVAQSPINGMGWFWRNMWTYKAVLSI